MDIAEPLSPLADGRRRRGQDNRTRIVAAMLDLIRDGEMSPSAELVAARADVGLRTVFRHFEDMDSLYREMSGVIEEEINTICAPPFRATDWPDRLMELIERRSIVFEKIAPFKRASEAIRHRSKFLAADGVKLTQAQRALLLQQVPAEIAADPVRLESLDLLLSFESWARLRREQGLSAGQARQILEATVRLIIA